MGFFFWDLIHKKIGFLSREKSKQPKVAKTIKEIKRVIHPKEIEILRDIGYKVEGSFSC